MNHRPRFPKYCSEHTPTSVINPVSLKQFVTPYQFYSVELGVDFKFKRAVWNEAGLCPFHGDRNRGSFHVNLATGAYRCFSCGAAGGDIIAFTEEKHCLSFRNALQWIASQWGFYE